MDKKNGREGKFKSKGVSILKGSPTGPKSMTEFLAHPEEMDMLNNSCNIANVQRHNGTPAQKHSSQPSGQPRIPEDSRSVTNQIEDLDPVEITRIHVHIRKDLADKLVEAVFNRKRDRSFKRKDATQRVIIEQALETWFENHPA
jgi:hypothetical protein